MTLIFISPPPPCELYACWDMVSMSLMTGHQQITLPILVNNKVNIVWVRAEKMSGFWKYLPQVDPVLIFLWNPSDKQILHKWISELILWGDKIMSIDLPTIPKYHIISTFYLWSECILRKQKCNKTTKENKTRTFLEIVWCLVTL